MLQLAPIILVAVILARDEGLVLPWMRDAGWGWPWLLVFSVVPIAVILLAAHGVVLLCNRRMIAKRSVRPLQRADRLIRIARVLIIAHFAASVFVFDWIGLVRSVTGDLVLVDEVIGIAPALIGLAGTWWVYYPIEQRMQNALLIRRLDEGQPVYPTLSRFAYTLLQARMHLFVMLVPLLMILGVSETIDSIARHFEGSWTGKVMAGSTTVAGVLVFIIAPPVICAMLDVTPMREGPIRRGLLELAKQHRVRLRNILVWNTAGTMINAAVLGLIGWFRYVLITDALLDVMSRRQVLAVMAHEVGHVRRHHMPWLAGSLIAALFMSLYAVSVPMYLLSQEQLDALQPYQVSIEFGLVAASMAISLLLFGWVCRRFERQADTFAVQHLSANGIGDECDQLHVDPPPSERVTLESVEAMQSALQAIARLNAIDPKRPSWRHGSIAWRQEYLASLPGQMLNRLEIDRVIVRIKGITAATLLVALAVSVSSWMLGDGVGPIDDSAIVGVKTQQESLNQAAVAGTDEVP